MNISIFNLKVGFLNFYYDIFNFKAGIFNSNFVFSNFNLGIQNLPTLILVFQTYYFALGISILVNIDKSLFKADFLKFYNFVHVFLPFIS